MFLRWRHEVFRWLNALRRDPSPHLRWSSQAEEAEAMKPIVRQYCLITGLYYPFVVADRFVNEHGPALMVMLSVTLAAMMFAVYGWLALRKPTSRRRLLTINLGLNLLLYLNPVAFQLLHFERERLIYFLFLIFIYAVTGVSLWAVALSVGVALTTLIAFGVLGPGAAATHSSMLMLIIIPVIVLIFNAIRTSMLQAVRAQVVAEGMRNEAQKLADCDALTGLPNRRSFFTAFEAARAAGRGFDLLLVDLDGFKPINDIYGHSVGDALLIDVAARLREVCGEAATPSRMGGDEFAILTHAAMSDDALEDLGARLCERLRETYLLGGVTANISASLGMTHADDPGMSASHCLERADYALYFAKQNLRGAPVVFNARHEADMRNFNLVDQTLRNSDLDRELSIVFQPQVDVTDGRTVSFEALARWDSVKLGAVRPDIFIRAAERSGLITDITLHLLQKALRRVADWPVDTRVSFNLSARDLRSSLSIDNIIRTVRESGVDPSRIEFEITETAMLSDFEQACEALSRLKAMGCRIAVDDFGAGYSSFSYIHRLPVDKIKIDRSFVVQLVSHPSAIQIVKTIIELARNLNLDCVIEGVETMDEMDKLRQVRARYVQGYLFSKPMPASEVAAWLAMEQRRIAV
ncbi:MAG: putative bifunctional diguanylate cyclase/phosphodiesterase [Asticcacaulis sp.]|uniref:putative bifunctional diguanylate cyclase/phosphodiesterase n=1 Tax=Asticcacaulis sp. TaxID=1872648 RepID=UPI003F7CA957